MNPKMQENRNSIKAAAPQINRFHIALAAHCNLNCWGCDHFSPIVEEEFPSFEQVRNDLHRMAFLTNANVPLIHLAGGEPLLNPRIDEYMEVTRFHFPETEIKIITNGILLKKMPKGFWESASRHRIHISVTKYPLPLDFDFFREKANSENVQLSFFNEKDVVKTSFKMPLDLSGRQDVARNFEECIYVQMGCFQLKNGKFFRCPASATIGYFNNYYNLNIPVSEKDFVDIHQVENFEEILDFIAAPQPLCAYCNVKKRAYGLEWTRSTRDISEWV